METNRFDTIARQLTVAGTRRQALLALAAGSLSLGTRGLADVTAKQRKPKPKRCKPLGQTCKPAGKRKCCGDLLCQVRTGNTAADCCLALGSPCESAEDCCAGACLPPLIGDGPKTCRVVNL